MSSFHRNDKDAHSIILPSVSMHIIYDEVRKLLKIGIGRPMGEEGKPLELGFFPADLLHSSFSLSRSGRIFTLQQGIIFLAYHSFPYQ